MENTKQNKTNASHDGSVETGPRDVFLELLRMATLYMSAISVGTLLFQFINIYLPDALNNYRSVTRSGLRFSLAMLVIVFPVFVWVSRYIKKEIKEYPKKAELKIRKWLLSFTLFAAGLLIIGDLIALVNGYLQGELTGRFILKVLVVLLIAGAVFRYYLWQLKGERANKNKLMKLMEQIIIGLVGIILVAGFVVAGSPQEERLRRFDERRINDLNSIQWQVVNFWQQKDRLPNELSELEDPISGYRVPSDPKTGESYEYNVLGDLSFELCATFDAESENMESEVSPRAPFPKGEMSQSWAHDAGRECFEREIDPELYGGEDRPVPVGR